METGNGSGKNSLLPPPLQRRFQNNLPNAGSNQGSNWRATASHNLHGGNPFGRGRPAMPHAHQRDRGGRGFHSQPDRGRGRSQNHPQRDFRQGYRQGHGLNFAELLENISKEESTMVVLKLTERSNDLEIFVKSKLELEEFRLLLQVLHKVCESDYDQNKSLLINRACHPDFLSLFPTMLVEGSMQDNSTFEQVAGDIILFFNTLVMMLPITAAGLRGTVQSCFSSIQGICSQGSVAAPAELMEKYASVLRDVEALQLNTPKANNSSWLSRKKAQVEKMKYEQPPNNFRDISIHPTIEEVLNPSVPFLRPNVVEGPYYDVEHYLDTQFRLLREDFVRPLREGVQDILKNTSRRKCESLSVRIYNNVQFLNFVRETGDKGRVLNEGMLLCFDANGKRFRRTNWEHTKKFMHGALLCFTSDNFKTLLFATVSSRDLKYLRNCQILVNFCEKYGDGIYDPRISYTMIESEVFFEPYFQVLNSLKSLGEHNFPMAKYFIHVQKEDVPPTYLKINAVPPAHPMYIAPNINAEVKIWVAGKNGKKHPITVLQENTWPHAEQLGLDSSQYKALQAALTRELVVIQGPPGTGKTFMALKIAEILIENKNRMNRSTPILVVCLTNHALDQFLMGMLKFTDNLVRIGGQSKCEQLENYNLKRARFRRSHSSYETLDLLSSAYNELSVIEQRLENIIKAISTYDRGILLNPTDQNGEKMPKEWLLGESLPQVLGIQDNNTNDTSFFTAKVASSDFVLFEDLHSLLAEKKANQLESLNSVEDMGVDEKAYWANDILQNHYYMESELTFLEHIFQNYQHVKGQGSRLAQAKNLWNLNWDERLHLYMHMLRAEKSGLEKEQQRLINDVHELKARHDELRNMEQVSYLQDQDVIGLTTNGAARLHSMLKALGCEIVIVEEAAEVMESHIVACVSSKCKQLVLIGDHKQLRPSVTVYELGKLYNLDISLFERMVINREGCITLQVQHRMCPEMAQLIVPTVYKTLDNHESVIGRSTIRSLPKRLFFKTHTEPEAQDHENSSRTNEFEAEYLLALCKHLLKQGYTPSQITLLSTYKGQMFLMKKIIREQNNYEGLKEVYVTVVDNYQGEENDIILLSLVRSNDEGRIGFLSTENRVCVALSRAKLGFIIVGNMGILAAENKTWKAVKKTLEGQDAVGPALPVRCEVHPDEKFSFEIPEDASKFAPFGGCTLLCDVVMDCGHQCNHTCHLMTKTHSQIKCQKPCNRKCEADLHLCQMKCYIKCGSHCQEKLDKLLPCGHEANVKCYLNPENVACLEMVEKTFPECQHTATVACRSMNCPNPCELQVPCGHSCVRTCHTNSDPDHLEYKCQKPCSKLRKGCRGDHPCTKKCSDECSLCEEKVNKKRSCGHSFKMSCHEDPEERLCNSKCSKSLECGHFCQRKCREECNPCVQPLDKVIEHCGHTVKVPCGRDPLKEDCDQKCDRMLACGHSCKGNCAEECTVKCREVVGMEVGSCGHEVKQFCFEARDGIPADFMRCTAKCGKKLECGHQCSGTCKTCHQGRFHVSCKEKCLKELVCGHKCKSDCNIPCPPCTLKTNTTCAHGTVKPVPCGMKQQDMCRKKCEYHCKHSKCTRDCGMPCNRNPCLEDCEKKLPCGHQCIGFCGEACPGLCWDCDKMELQKNSFATDATIPLDLKFILLPDCHHTIEVSSLESWFEWQDLNLETRVCPRCKTTISNRLQRYKSQISQPHTDWNRIKGKMQRNDRDVAFTLERILGGMLVSEEDGEISLPSSLSDYLSELKQALSMVPSERGASRGRGRFGGNKYPRPGHLDFQLIKMMPVLEIKVAVLSQMIDIVGNRALLKSDMLAQITFLLTVIKNCKQIWLQQFKDFQALLSQLRTAVLECAESRPVRFQWRNNCELKLPVQQLKCLWQKCSNCGQLKFGLKENKGSTTHCDNCSLPFPLERPNFEALDPMIHYDRKGRALMVVDTA